MNRTKDGHVQFIKAHTTTRAFVFADCSPAGHGRSILHGGWTGLILAKMKEKELAIRVKRNRLLILNDSGELGRTSLILYHL